MSLIPKELLPYAGAVVRNSEVNYEVRDIDYSNYRVKKAITVFNESGDDAAEILIWYNKLRQVKSVKGIIYDSSGLPVSKFSEKNFDDYYGGGRSSLFEDTRVKVFRPGANGYPYTVEYECDIRDNQTMIISDWVPANMFGVAVEKSSLTFTCKPSLAIRYKEYNMPVKAVIVTDKAGFKTYTWQISNARATRYEPYSPPPETFLSMVKIAPVTFTYQKIHGSYNNWNELGKWIYDVLLTDRDILTPSTIATIKSMTAGLADPKLKAKKVYEYMQNKTRYISVQVGIGGYRPFPASEVDQVSYGDCKALTNYMRSLLKAVDIESYYCHVEAGTNRIDMDPDFASMTQANHAILCIPFKNDTTFLECTNQKIPFGFVGDFTDDRTVLACTPDGGRLIRTPKYNATVSTQVRKATLNLDAAGTLNGYLQTEYKGSQYDNRDQIIDELPAERIKKFKKIYPINNLEIDKLELTQDKSLQPVTKEHIIFSADNYASAQNDKLHFSPNIVNQMRTPLREVNNRKNLVYINRGYTDDDEIIYKVPEGFKLEKHPLNVVLIKPFGIFNASVTFKDGQLIYKRRLQINDGAYSKDIYPDMVNFYQEVVDADNYTAILGKN
ncbi:DUF3857 domain-containing protein [Mucilaginibacter hurinus]|uniref:DUF3857 domain-containing protein n=1 Tax=Mucilaginibacter hurinus TaxID=2201324 RepID=UPI001314B9B4|nr:DUF3857 domain-containing protein [Mucilaginibacter hurinus]